MRRRRAHAGLAIVALVALLGIALVPATADAKRRGSKISRSFKKLKRDVKRIPKRNLSTKTKRRLQKKVRKAKRSYRRGRLCKALFQLGEMREPARDTERWKRFSKRRSRRIEKDISRLEKLISNRSGAESCTSRPSDLPEMAPQQARGPYPAVERKIKHEPRPPNITKASKFRPVEDKGPEANVVLDASAGRAGSHGTRRVTASAIPTRPATITQRTVLNLPPDQQGVETSVAAAGNVVFYTGNHFAAYSSDGGTNWTYVNPWETFPNSDGGFCCDQEVIYSASVDRFFWILEYIGPNLAGKGAEREGRLRIAVASPQQIVNSGAKTWTYYDIQPRRLGLSGQYFDFSHPAVGSSNFYLSWLVWGSRNGNAITRIPLKQLAEGRITRGLLQYDPGDFYRPVTQNAGSKALFARELDLNLLEVSSWDEDSETILTKQVPISTIATENWVSKTPAGNDWLDRFPPGWGIVGAARSGDEAWFAWSAARGVQRGDGTVDQNAWPQPHIEGAVIDVDKLTLKRQFYIWNRDYAFRYPALSAVRGEVAIAFAFGGGRNYASTGVGMISNGYYLIGTATGNGPGSAGGDYMAVRPDVFPRKSFRGPAKFVAANFVQGEVARYDPEKETTVKRLENRDLFIRFQR